MQMTLVRSVVASIVRRKLSILGHHFLWDLLRHVISALSHIFGSVCFTSQEVSVSAGAALLQNPPFRSVSNNRNHSAVICLSACYRISAAGHHNLYIARIWLLIRVNSILSTVGTLSTTTSEFEKDTSWDRTPAVLKSLVFCFPRH